MSDSEAEEGEVTESSEAEEENGTGGLLQGGTTEEEPPLQEEDGDRISPEKLQALGASSTLREMLQNVWLRELLLEIDHSPNPQAALQRAMGIPVFVEFADECLKICGLRDTEEPNPPLQGEGSVNETRLMELLGSLVS